MLLRNLKKYAIDLKVSDVYDFTQHYDGLAHVLVLELKEKVREGEKVGPTQPPNMPAGGGGSMQPVFLYSVPACKTDGRPDRRTAIPKRYR